MKKGDYWVLLTVLLCSCDNPTKPKSSAVPDNVINDAPIILREGQAIMLIPEHDQDLKIAASVVDGKLTIAEVDFDGRSFGVAWSDSELWETNTVTNSGDYSLTILDRDGDGVPDLKIEIDSEHFERSELHEIEWKPEKKAN